MLAKQVDHAGDPVGHVVASLGLTPELQAVLGINVDQAWIVAARIEDPQMYEALKASRGDMSIQGMARRKVKQ